MTDSTCTLSVEIDDDVYQDAISMIGENNISDFCAEALTALVDFCQSHDSLTARDFADGLPADFKPIIANIINKYTAKFNQTSNLG
ncbi:hypothetical protein B0181_02455 [Moraxella caviae]|uniref:Uncharacterized protein n=1 Tax=Moraxella caviae TaxID=34060 RepID=A0A1T0A9E0_9GAMM|nr:hypothetical protein [Moraxella caviae]OOR91911.1 hypothetical protein B0181_02455 [Moraxella caviae]STZ09766.1 Uncharacterised protein [Moraxella caviae]